MKRWLPSALLAAYAVLVTAALLALYRGRSPASGGSNNTIARTTSAPAGSHNSPSVNRSCFDGAVAKHKTAGALPRNSEPVALGAPDAIRTVVFEGNVKPSTIRVSDSLQAEAASIAAAAAQRAQERVELLRTPATELTGRDIFLLADAVDREANSRLMKVAAKYDLTDHQQERAFWIFAGASSAYHPVLGGQTAPAFPVNEDAIVVSPVAAVEEKVVDELIHDVLDENQKADFEDEWVDRDLWWTEIIGLLSDDVDAEVSTTQEDPEAAPATTEEIEPEDHLGGNLFDLLGH